jgi:uncharacterized RDD family membrane protein YckC
VPLSGGQRAGRHVRRRAEVERGLEAGQPRHDRRVLGGPEPVCDPDRLQLLERGRHRFGTRPLTRVDERGEGKPPYPIEDLPKFPGRDGRFVPAESEPADTRPGRGLVEVKNPVRRVGSPLPSGVEEDDDPPAGAILEPAKDLLERRSDPRPVEPDPLDHRGRHVDLGVRDVLPREAADEITSDGCVVGGRLQAPTDVAVEGEEVPEIADPLPRPDRGKIGEYRLPETPGQPDESRRCDSPFQVKMQLRLWPRSEDVEERTDAGREWGHVNGSYSSRTGSVERGREPRVWIRERTWKRGAALGLDLLLLGGGPLLLSTAAVFGVLLAYPQQPLFLPWLFRGAQALFLLTFLLRDSLDVSPGKRLFGLRVIRLDGGRVTPLDSFVRNLPLVLPPWSFLECVPALRREDGRRSGDRMAGTRVVEE